MPTDLHRRTHLGLRGSPCRVVVCGGVSVAVAVLSTAFGRSRSVPASLGAADDRTYLRPACGTSRGTSRGKSRGTSRSACFMVSFVLPTVASVIVPALLNAPSVFELRCDSGPAILSPTHHHRHHHHQQQPTCMARRSGEHLQGEHEARGMREDRGARSHRRELRAASPVQGACAVGRVGHSHARASRASVA